MQTRIKQLLTESYMKMVSKNELPNKEKEVMENVLL